MPPNADRARSIGAALPEAWSRFCAVLLALALGTRALHFAAAGLPEWLDAPLGRVMSLHFMIFMNQIGNAVRLALLGALALGVWGALRLWRGRSGAIAGGRRLDPWLASWLWLALVVDNHCLDLDPDLATFTLVSLPVLWLPARWEERAGAPARRFQLRVAAAGLLLALWMAFHRGAFDALFACAWLAFALAWSRQRPRFAEPRDWWLCALVAAAALQVSTLGFGLLPEAVRGHGGRRVADAGAYDWCEDAARGRVFATFPSCRGESLAVCADDYVGEYERDSLVEVARHRFFDEAFFGRMLHLLCLEETVQVGMAETRIDGERYFSNVLEFESGDPLRFTRDRLGKGDGRGVGAIFLRDRRGGAVFYTSEFFNKVLRVPTRTGGSPRRMFYIPGARAFEPPHRVAGVRLSFPGSLVTGPDAVREDRRTGFFGEWIRGSRVFEIDLDTLGVVAHYATHNGGNAMVAVDEQRGRLIASGVWGLEVFDLASGRRIARQRTPPGPRRPTIDAARGLVYVPVTFGHEIRVLDRETLEPLGGLAVGAGARNALLTADGRTLLAGGTGGSYSFDAAALGERFSSSPRSRRASSGALQE